MVEIQQIKIEDTELLEEFYNNILTKTFKDANIIESLENIKEQQIRGNTQGSIYCIIVAKKYNKIVGGTIFDYYSNSNSGVIEYSAVIENEQSKGIGRTLYEEVLRTLDKEAQAVGYTGVGNIFVELSKKDIANSSKNTNFRIKTGYRACDFKYKQPPLDEGKEQVDNLYLIALEEHKNTISSKTIVNFLHDYIYYAMGIDPLTNIEYSEMSKKLKETEEVKLIQIKELNI